MPFDCAPVLDVPSPSPAFGDDRAETRTVTRTAGPIRVRPIPAWYINGQAERAEAAIAVPHPGSIFDRRRTALV